jgi:GNAT superfamily N-acetyltransferase
MTIVLRPAHADEASVLSALCLRSKAHWGYDAAFMRACVAELTLRPEDLTPDTLVVAEIDGALAGMAQVGPVGADADLMAMFIDPDYIGQNLGRVLFNWCVETARATGAARLMIDADPQAAGFYTRMGAVQIGTTPSGSIPGRVLPLLEYPLR